MIAIDLIFLAIYIGLIGWAAHSLFFHDSDHQEPGLLEPILLKFLSGFGVVSIILLAAALTGLFFKTVVFSASLILILFSLIRESFRQSLKNAIFVYYIVFCLLLGLLSFAIAKLTPPYEAVIYGSDASSYVASAFQLTQSGGISYVDPLILKMKPPEREFFYSETEKTYGRFPGGVLIVRRDLGVVNFGFLPLFPAWLGFGLLTLGSRAFLSVLSFFLALGLVVLFMLGRKLSGWLVALCLPLILFFFYPEFYFSRTPFSEGFAQILFCSGLYVFLTNPSPRMQRLCGILWGCSFLCRIDLPFFLIGSLLLLFCIDQKYASRWSHWRTFFIALATFELCAFYWQLRTGAHLWIPTLSQGKLSQILWLPLVSRSHSFMVTHRIFGPVLFTIFSVLVLLLLHRWLSRRTDRHSRFIRLLPLVAVIATLILVGKYFRWDKFLAHLKWMFVYFSPYQILALVAGCLLFLYIDLRAKQSGVSRSLLLLLIPPALFYLILPIIKWEQPLLIRRFVPEVFPLLFLMSLAGWKHFLEKLSRRQLIPQLVFVLFVLSMTASFFKASSYLREEPVLSGVIDQIRRIAGRFPDNALLITPSADAGIQLGLPLNYGMNRETISMLDENYPLIEDFLKREVKTGRPIYLLSLIPEDANASSQLQNSFSLKPEFKEQISFSIVAPAKPDQFPDRTMPMQLLYSVKRLVPKRILWKDQIAYDDADVRFVNFYVTEKGFRWTKNHSEIRDFVFETNGRQIRLVFSTNPLSQRIAANSIHVFLNSDIPTRLVKRGPSTLYFLTEKTQIQRIESLTIESKTFIPANVGLNNDQRSLGIPFVKITFLRE